MKKNVILNGIAITLFIVSCIFFSRAYEQVRWHSASTERSVEVYAAFHKLSLQVSNAAIMHPGLPAGSPGQNPFFTDSASVIDELNLLRRLVRDSVNVRIAERLNKRVRAELSWMLASNVTDSIQSHSALLHLKALAQIDSLIHKGAARTQFLFRYRKAGLENSLKAIRVQIITFLVSASLLLIYVMYSLAREYNRRRKKEAILEAQEKRFRALVENSQDLIVMVDEHLKSIYRSPAAVSITGYNDEERRQYNNVDQVHPDDRVRIKAYLDKMKGNPGLVIPASYRILHKLGHYIWLEGTFTSLLHEPSVSAIVINMRDVSRRMADEEELKHRERRFRDTLENMMEGVQIIDFNWRYIYVNDALIQYSTYTKDAMVGRTVMELYPGVENSQLYSVLKQCMQLRETRQLESEFVFPDGTKKYFDLRIQPVPEGVFILSIDITERKKNEEEIAKVNRLYAFISAINQSIVHIADRGLLISKACDIATGIGGFQMAWIEMWNDKNKAEVVGISGEAESIKVIKSIAVDYSQPPYCDTPAGLAIRSGTYAVNNRLQEDPKLTPLQEGFVAFKIQSSISVPIRIFGNMVGIFTLTSAQRDLFDMREIALLQEAAGDISFALENFEKAAIHRRTQDLVLSNERRFRALLEKSTDMKTLTSVQGLFIYVSPSVLTTFGYEDENEIIGKSSFEFFHPDDRQLLLQHRRQMLQTPGSFFAFQYRIRHKAGYWIWCEGTLTNLLNEPDVHALVSNFRDITQRKYLEEQKEVDAQNLRRYTKNLEQFTYVVSHNLRAPIAHILGLANVMKGNLSAEDRDRSQAYLFSAVNQLDMVITDLNKILEVRAANGLNREEVNLHELLRDVRRAIGDTTGHKQVSIEEDLEVVILSAFKSYVYSVFLNLIENAIKYGRDGVVPVIRISSRLVNNMIELRVADNGTGMDLAQYGDKVFGMYQRFHLSIVGKGLGLFMIKTQVEAMNGSISVSSQPGQGTEFVIVLPVNQSTAS